MAKKKRDPLKNRWHHMFEKCTCETSRQYKDFGGRGITICEEWNNFEKFKEWSLENGYIPGIDIELGRINQNGNFEPSNCRYVTPEEQSNNRRTCKQITYQGVTGSMKDVCRQFNRNYYSVKQRIERGWDTEKAMITDLPFFDKDKGRKRAKKAS